MVDQLIISLHIRTHIFAINFILFQSRKQEHIMSTRRKMVVGQDAPCLDNLKSKLQLKLKGIWRLKQIGRYLNNH